MAGSFLVFGSVFLVFAPLLGVLAWWNEVFADLPCLVLRRVGEQAWQNDDFGV